MHKKRYVHHLFVSLCIGVQWLLPAIGQSVNTGTKNGGWLEKNGYVLQPSGSWVKKVVDQESSSEYKSSYSYYRDGNFQMYHEFWPKGKDFYIDLHPEPTRRYYANNMQITPWPNGDPSGFQITYTHVKDGKTLGRLVVYVSGDNPEGKGIVKSEDGAEVTPEPELPAQTLAVLAFLLIAGGTSRHGFLRDPTF